MKYNPEKHHRRSIRLKGYDYSRAGLYFVTICCQHRACLFGHILVGTDPRVSPKIILNPAGQTVVRWYYQLQQKFPNIICHEMIVMPNHFHCIIEIINIENVPNTGNVMDMQNNMGDIFPGKPENILGEHKGSPLHRMVQWFKTMSTNEYIRGVKTLGWMSFNGKLWQRNYYEHIIRNETSYRRISEYIRNNPIQWAADKFWGK